MNAKQVKKEFKEEVLPKIISRYGKDKVAIRTAFNDYTDALCKEGRITQRTYDTITL